MWLVDVSRVLSNKFWAVPTINSQVVRSRNGGGKENCRFSKVWGILNRPPWLWIRFKCNKIGWIWLVDVPRNLSNRFWAVPTINSQVGGSRNGGGKENCCFLTALVFCNWPPWLWIRPKCNKNGWVWLVDVPRDILSPFQVFPTIIYQARGREMRR